ncbi:MAG: hypothetical protein ACLTZG_29340 [Hungatella hathewayi]|uniref:hypothetical protein n=1 Tax=Hungatella hathewayi TaxID=154046 RepID=UPI003995EE85
MRRWLLTAALVCALASGGCASKYTGQENGKAEEQSNQALRNAVKMRQPPGRQKQACRKKTGRKNLRRLPVKPRINRTGRHRPL